MEKRRSVGVTVFGWLYIVLGVFGVLAFFQRNSLIVFSAPLSLLSGIGLLKLKEWARILTIILTIVGVLFRAIIYLRSILLDAMPLNEALIFIIEWNFLTWIIAIIIIYFFTRPKVKEQFR